MKNAMHPCLARIVSTAFCLFALAVNCAVAGVWKFAVLSGSDGDASEGTNSQSAWVNTNVLSAIARQITNDRPDFVLVAGDMITGNSTNGTTNLVYQYTQWLNSFACVYAARIPVYAVRGDNEAYAGDTNDEAFLAAFGAAVPQNGPEGEVGKTFSFVHTNALIVGLDDYQKANQVNQAWLDAQLSANTLPHVFIFGHEPAVQVLSSNCLARERDARNLFLDSITRAGGRMYFCGHDHFYNRARVTAANGINFMQVLTGAGGAPFENWDGVYGKDFGDQNMASFCSYSAGTHGYVLVTVSNFNVTMAWKGSANVSGLAPLGLSSGPRQESFAAWPAYDTYSFQATNPAIRNVTDYDGDSCADLAVYSESAGEIMTILSAHQFNLHISRIGGAGAVMAPGDYDGDGIADLSVYWRTSGLWETYLSDHSYAVITSILGGSGHTPTPADYDGDGKTDMAVYEKSSGVWLIVYSSNGDSASHAWGGPGWNPVVADYDGDGKADIVVYRETTGEWQALCSAGQPLGYYIRGSMAWGGPGYRAFATDFDDDGRADPALFEASTGLFLAMFSGSAYQICSAFFNPNSVTETGDYDHDGRSDPMVYSQSMATWQAAMSASGYIMYQVSFGGPGWTSVQNGLNIDLVFLAFGDSITYGGGSSSDGPATAYPIMLEDKLKANYAGSFTSINAGNPGETTSEGIVRYPAWLDSADPDIVLIMEGTNDCFDQAPFDRIENNLRFMVESALTRGIKVIIATIPPVISNSYRDRSVQQSLIIAFNPRIYKIAADYNIPVAPVFEAITSVPNWENTLMDQPSANHPNDAGHRVIRDTFYAIISSGIDSGVYY